MIAKERHDLLCGASDIVMDKDERDHHRAISHIFKSVRGHLYVCLKQIESDPSRLVSGHATFS
jgi:hypothetical protein